MIRYFEIFHHKFNCYKINRYILTGTVLRREMITWNIVVIRCIHIKGSKNFANGHLFENIDRRKTRCGDYDLGLRGHCHRISNNKDCIRKCTKRWAKNSSTRLGGSGMFGRGNTQPMARLLAHIRLQLKSNIFVDFTDDWVSVRQKWENARRDAPAAASFSRSVKHALKGGVHIRHPPRTGRRIINTLGSAYRGFGYRVILDTWEYFCNWNGLSYNDFFSETRVLLL